MKRFIPIMLCLALLFGGLVGCATTNGTDTVQKELKVVDFDFVKEDQLVRTIGCTGTPAEVEAIFVVAVMSDDTRKRTNLVLAWDVDCFEYGLHYLTREGSTLIGKFLTLETAKEKMLKELPDG